VRQAVEASNLDGYWILVDYIDSIFQDKAIAKHRLQPFSWGAMSLHIRQDSLFSIGILFLKKQIKINLASDSLGMLVGEGVFELRYNGATDRIEATERFKNAPEASKGAKFVYKRVTEQHLIDILSSGDGPTIQAGFNQLFVDSLLAGHYKSLADGNTMNLYPNKFMTGFKQYNRYFIHDYFGTYHPYGNLDVVAFEDTTIVANGQAKPSDAAIRLYNWVRTGDTLTLTEMLTRNDETYALGNKRYQFIKLKW
jgi:hypothetical protein